MANTYTQIHIQVVFSVQDRSCIIRKTWKNELFQYITGIIQNHGHKVLAINGMPDHLHIFFGMRPSQSLSDLMQDIKGDSSKWINNKKFVAGRFSCQEGFGGFSYSKSHVDNVIESIKKNRKFIIERNHLLKNTSNFLKSLRSLTTKDLFSTRWNMLKKIELCL